jgi:UDP-N-acetylglucosamine 2-epimerase
MTIVGTRPEIIKMSRVIAELDLYSNHILVNTQQNCDYELNNVFFDELQIRKPDYFLGVSNVSFAKSIAEIIEKSDYVIAKEMPDAILIYGDTNSCLSAISAKRRKIPIFHMEAGNRCFDQRVPEEINRKIIDHLSDANLVINEHARRNLIQEGISSDLIFKTGSHMPEVFDYYMPMIKKSDILKKLKINRKKYFLVSIHRDENLNSKESIKNIFEILTKISSIYKLPILVSTHPRLRKALESSSLNMKPTKIKFLKPFGFFDYIKLQCESFCIISDSGTISEEASLLNLPAINFREITERPESLDAGTVIMSGTKKENVIECIKIVIDQQNVRYSHPDKIDDYSSVNVSKKILRIVYGYVDYINRKIWFR